MPRIALLILAVLLTVAPAAADYLPEQPRRALVGMNLSGLSPISSQWVFADLFKSSNAWWSPAGMAPSGYTAEGWPILNPGQRADSWITLWNPNYPAGQYTVTWQGSGGFNFSVDGSGSFASSGGSSTRTLNVTPGTGQGLYMIIHTSSPADPIRDVQVLPPGYGPGQPYAGQRFHHTFQQRLEPFGTIRFMDLMSANHNSVQHWDDRPKLADARWTDSRGAPVEVMVELANAQRSDPWFTMPAMADDDYVRNFALYVRNHLDPSLKVYVEYGNEVWAPTVSGQPGVAHTYLQQRAQQTGNDWWVQWAEEAKRDFRIWHEVFAGQEERIVRVAAAQAENRWHTPRFYEALNGEFDVMSIAAYVGVNPSGYGASTSSDRIIDDLLANVSHNLNATPINRPGHFTHGQPTGTWIWHRQLAEHWSNQLGRHIPVIAYEGGQHVVPGSLDAPWYDAYVQAQRDPRMRDVYIALLNGWFGAAGAEGFVNFSNVGQIAQWGAWGVLEYQDQPIEQAPKYQALLDWIAGRHEWTRTSGGNWSTAAHWSMGPANSAGAVAAFGGSISTAATITVNAPQKVGALRFDSTHAYTVAGPHAITLDAAGGPALIHAVRGSHTVTAPLAVRSDLVLAVDDAGATLSLPALHAPDHHVLKAGPGRVDVHRLTAAGLAIEAGTLRLTAADNAVGQLALAPAARLDLGAHGLFVADASLHALWAMVASGHAGGAWDGAGITSSVAAADNAYRVGLAPLDGGVLLRVTLGGDATLSGSVDVEDLHRLAQNWMQSGRSWYHGDFNYDGVVDVHDLTILALNWNTSAGMSLAQAMAGFENLSDVAIPEPSGAAALGAVVLLGLRRSRR